MKLKPHMSELQKELVHEFSKWTRKEDIYKLLRLHDGFETIAPSTLLRWTKKGKDEEEPIKDKIKKVISILRNAPPSDDKDSMYRKAKILVELDSTLRALSDGKQESIRPLLEGLVNCGRDEITLHDLVFIIKTQKTLGIKLTSNLVKELLDANKTHA